MGNKRRLVIVFVHGTWAFLGLKKWATDPESGRLGQHLRHQFPDAEFRSVSWNSRNQFVSRKRVVPKLKGELYDIRREDPSSDIVVIAHSHGGNIAYEAWVDDRNFRLITLGTPFFHTNAIAGGEFANDSFYLGLFGWGSIQAWVFFRGVVDQWFKNDAFWLKLADLLNKKSWPTPLRSEFAANWVTLMLVLWLCQLVSSKVSFTSTGPNPSEAIVDEPDSRGKMLILRTANDEASGAIGLATFFGRVCEMLTALGPTRPLPAKFSLQTIPAYLVRLLLFFGWAALCIAFFPFLFILRALSYILTCCAMGVHAPRDLLDVVRSTEAAPLGRHDVRFVPLPSVRGSLEWSHSVYGNNLAIFAATEWIAETSPPS